MKQMRKRLTDKQIAFLKWVDRNRPRIGKEFGAELFMNWETQVSNVLIEQQYNEDGDRPGTFNKLLTRYKDEYLKSLK